MLHAKVHAPLPHAADALAIPGDGQTFVHIPQLLASVAVFTHTPLHIVGADAGQVHMELAQTVLPAHAYVAPQPPQLSLSLVKFTQAPLQSV